MPRSVKLGSEQEAESQLIRAISSQEVQDFIRDGYKLSVAIVEIDDLTPNESHPFVTASVHATASDMWQHETMLDLCRLCSGTYKSKVGAVYCWKYGDNRVMALDFSKDESELGLYLDRFIERRTSDASAIEEVVGSPTVSVGAVKSSEVSTLSLMDKAQSRIRKAKGQGKNKSVTQG